MRGFFVSPVYNRETASNYLDSAAGAAAGAAAASAAGAAGAAGAAASAAAGAAAGAAASVAGAAAGAAASSFLPQAANAAAVIRAARTRDLFILIYSLKGFENNFQILLWTSITAAKAETKSLVFICSQLGIIVFSLRSCVIQMTLKNLVYCEKKTINSAFSHALYPTSRGPIKQCFLCIGTQRFGLLR